MSAGHLMLIFEAVFPLHAAELTTRFSHSLVFLSFAAGSSGLGWHEGIFRKTAVDVKTIW